MREADWAPDGERLAIIRNVDGHDRLEFPMGTVVYEAVGYLSDPRVSPTGDRIAFFEHPTKYDDRGSVAVVDLAGKKTTVADGFSGLEGLAWEPRRGELLFGATRDSLLSIYGVVPGGQTRLALQSAGGISIQDIAPDGRWLVTRDDISVAMSVKQPGAQESDLSWLDFTSAVRFAPDNRTLLFIEQGGRGGNYATALRRTDGSPAVFLGPGLALDLSPDGKFALSVLPASPSRLMMYPTGAGEARSIDIGAINSLDTARWFPDGQHVLICGAEPGHAARCYVSDLHGPPRAVTPDDVGGGLPGPDNGHFLARRGGTGSRLNYASTSPEMYALDGQEPRPVPGLMAEDVLIRFAPDGRSVIVSKNIVPAPVERVFLDTGRREPMYEITPSGTSGMPHVSGLVVADEPAIYAYSRYQYAARLFVVQGAR